MIHQAFWLAKKEFRQHWRPVMLTVLVTAFWGLIVTQRMPQLISNLFVTEKPYSPDFIIDAFFIGMTPSLAAIFMSGPYLSWRTIKEDPFTKRIALFRSLPISVAVLALSRTIMMLGTWLLMSTVFYLIITIGLSEEFFSHISLSTYAAFIVFWLGYSLALGGLNPFLEYGTNGKMLHLSPVVLIVLFISVIAITHYFSDYGIVEWSFLFIQEYGWMVSFAMLFVGLIGVYVWNFLLSRRLQRRDYL
ncbi:hypothetical protein JCM9140_1332 [Halalkalibacter wakoensis JCM 9140]|uniref:ABC transporter n=1 Tax=Halalkalibacter wakoensis JCM 9140 TaxID=1236970 RepID=W4Q019_9BACI|nr:hypothetical protein [Halalkalibacter wakoensis]GAE25342.1 hypothetical protein JCM9140_1332 [Halalkalibacter wakoensis JCM 9140]